MTVMMQCSFHILVIICITSLCFGEGVVLLYTVLKHQAFVILLNVPLVECIMT